MQYIMLEMMSILKVSAFMPSYLLFPLYLNRLRLPFKRETAAAVRAYKPRA